MRAVCVLLLLLLAGCGTSVTPLAYAPTVTPVAGAGTVQVAPPTDVRTRTDPNDFGTIRGGFGQPIKSLRSDIPITAVVARAMSDALAQRNMLARGAAPVEIRLTIGRIDASRLIRLEAHAFLRAQLVETASGRVLWEGTGQSNQTSGSVLALDNGIFASPTELAALTAKAMSEAIDRIVDDPAFRRAVGGGGAGIG